MEKCEVKNKEECLYYIKGWCNRYTIDCEKVIKINNEDNESNKMS